MEEQIAATLEQRGYRYEAIMPAMGAAMIGSMAEMSAPMDTATPETRAPRDVGEFGEENDPDEGTFD